MSAVRTSFVIHKVKTKDRPRQFKGRMYTPKATRDYEKQVEAAFRAMDVETKGCDRYYVGIAYYVLPRKMFGKLVLKDVDNVAKIILDGLNEVAWVDDCYVDELYVRRYTVDRKQDERVEVVIWGFIDE